MKNATGGKEEKSYGMLRSQWDKSLEDEGG